MEKPKLPVKEFLAHLRRQAVSEIISEECLAAFSNIKAQYGNEFSRVSGFEVRLGDDARYVDYILTAEEKNIPFADFIWIEIDYEQFAAEKKLSRVFLSTSLRKMAIIRNFGIKSCQYSWVNKERVNFVRRLII